MTGEDDQKDKTEARKIAFALMALAVLIGVGVMLLLPSLSGVVSEHLEPGIGLRTAAIISFFVSATLAIVFAIASGDGLLGELQFLIPGFLAFFVINWLLIAWIF